MLQVEVQAQERFGERFLWNWQKAAGGRICVMGSANPICRSADVLPAKILATVRTDCYGLKWRLTLMPYWPVELPAYSDEFLHIFNDTLS